MAGQGQGIAEYFENFRFADGEVVEIKVCALIIDELQKATKPSDNDQQAPPNSKLLTVLIAMEILQHQKVFPSKQENHTMFFRVIEDRPMDILCRWLRVLLTMNPDLCGSGQTTGRILIAIRSEYSGLGGCWFFRTFVGIFIRRNFATESQLPATFAMKPRSVHYSVLSSHSGGPMDVKVTWIATGSQTETVLTSATEPFA
ncbi:hypothetical protein AJ78_05912 [Emergomyces pasteurianus Ep9510]|uniref:Uncharacterized protein n=1 Tax=Emergomyces pasteurianus Ep9510 TaxID=1447872 RepID=A0A1J9QBY2_9EURO|nr:hypothetical protein AJ78_05912 [Emergomyces pasteurianus Ep9510]